MKDIVLAGTTDYTIDVFIQDSTSTTGAGKTGLAYNTASLTCYYRKGATGSATALTLATQTVGGAHSDGGFVEIDATNMPGMYRLDLSDTMVATAGSLKIMLKGATGMVPLPIEIQVAAINIRDGVRMALTALPNATPGAAGGLLIAGTNAQTLFTGLDYGLKCVATDTGGAGLYAEGQGTSGLGFFTAGDVNGYYNAGNFEIAGQLVTGSGIDGDLVGNVTGNVNGSVAGNVTGSVGSVTGNVGGNVVGSVGSVTAAVTVGTINANVVTATALDATAVAEIADGVWDEALAGHLTAGSTGAALNAAGSAGDPWSTALPGAYGAGTAGSIVGRIPDIAAGSAGGLFIAGTNAATTVAITGNITGNLSGSVGSVTAGVTVTTNNDKTGYRLSATGVDDILDEVVEGAVTLRESTRLANSALGAKVSGMDVSAPQFRDLADSKNRIVATTDADGNRTAVTLDLT